jgi:ABC-type transport system substrate-binding protein
MRDYSYWNGVLSSRQTRRRVLAMTAAAAGAGTLALAGCGGDDEPSGPKDASGLLLDPKDTSSSAKRGGTLNLSVGNPTVMGIDHLTNSFGAHFSGSYLYSQLTKTKTGTPDKLPDGAVEGDVAESWEISPDGLTATFKLKSVKFDSRAPTSGRVLNSGDVKFSWDNWSAVSPRRQELAQKVDPSSPILSVETPDQRTAVFKLSYPFAPLLAYLASNFHPQIYPVESDGGYDPRNAARGTAAWRLEQNNTPTSLELKRNPDYYDQKRPYVDAITIFQLPEYATRLTQFETGSLAFDTTLLQEDVLSQKRRNSAMQMVQRPFFDKICGACYFGRRQGSPFNDERVRKALSHVIDRNTWADTFSNREKFEAEGLPVETKWRGPAGPGLSWAADPKTNELDDGAKNFTYDVAEAKKLLQASGVKLPISVPYNTWPGLETPDRQALVGMLQATGDFQFSVNILTITDWITTIDTVKGDFNGISIKNYVETTDWDYTIFLK